MFSSPILTPRLAAIVTASDTLGAMRCLPWLAVLLVMAMAWSIVAAEALQDQVFLVQQQRSVSVESDQPLARTASSLELENPHKAGTARAQQLPSNAAQEAHTHQDKKRLESSLLYVAYRLLLLFPDPILLITQRLTNDLF